MSTDLTTTAEGESDKTLEQIEVELYGPELGIDVEQTRVATVLVSGSPCVIVWGARVFVRTVLRAAQFLPQYDHNDPGLHSYKEVTSAIAFTREQLTEMGVEAENETSRGE